MTQSLAEFRRRYNPSLNNEIERWIGALGTGPFAGMMRYQLGFVDERFQPVHGGGGKRFRPLLCLAVCDAVGGSWQGALPVAAGIELLHNFSLIHDDIEDHDPARHHRPTLWKLWGEPQAINTGDGMFALAAKAVVETRCAPEDALDLSLRFQDTALQLCRGQHLDMDFETRTDVTSTEYVEMISLKSAAIVDYACRAGAVVGGASPALSDALAGFGRSLGKAFQVHDDMQGVWASRERTGKEAATDLRNRKKSLPVLLAFQAADEEQRATLHRFYRRQDDALEPVIQILDQTDSRSGCEQVLTEFRGEALAHLSAARLSAQGADLLSNLVDELTAVQ
jgi:geranylgeranyl diphosphate synthase type I